MAKKKVKLSLLENGLDFVLHALEHLKNDNNDPRNIKFGVLHLSSGIELVLKKRLIMEHKALIYRDLNSFDHSNFYNSNSKTIFLEQIIKRLESFGGIKIDDKPFLSLKVLRNRFEHSSVNEDLILCKTTISQAIHSILTFIEMHIPGKKSNKAKALLEQIREKLAEFDTFYKEEMKKLSSSLNNEKNLFNCPVCKQLTFSIEKHYCFFCKTKYKNAKETALMYLFKVSEININKRILVSIFFYGKCPSCRSENIINVSSLFKETEHNIAFLCFDCGHKISIIDAKKCKTCERVLTERDEDICFHCELKSSTSAVESIVLDSQEMLRRSYGSLMIDSQELMKSMSSALDLSVFTGKIMDSMGGMESALLSTASVADLIPKLNMDNNSFLSSIGAEMIKIGEIQSATAGLASALTQGLSASLVSNIDNKYRSLYSALSNNLFFNVGNYQEDKFTDEWDDEDDEEGEIPIGEPT